MYKLSKYMVMAAVLATLSSGLTVEAKGHATRLTTDPEITAKAVAAQMNKSDTTQNVNLNNMLLKQNLGIAIPSVSSQTPSSLDVDLKKVVVSAIDNNRDITLADLFRQSAETDIRTAAAKKNPQLSYSFQRAQFPASTLTARQVGNNHSYSQGISVTLPIWTGGAVEGAINQARYAKDIAYVDYYKTQADTKLSAISAYYQYLEAIKLADVQNESVSNYQGHLNNVQQQFNAGIVAKLDVLTSEVSLADAKQKSISANNAKDIAEANLNNIMRLPMSTQLNPVDKDFPVPEFDLTMDEAIAIAQKYRWELIKADYAVKQANEALRIARAGYMPTIGVSGGYSWNEADVTAVKKDDWTVAGKVSWSIWDGGATDAAIKKAHIQIRTAQETLLQAREKIELEVRNDYLNVLAAKEQIKATEAAVAQAQEAYKIATVRYSSGVGINLDVLDAELQLNAAKTNYITALYNYNIGLATLEHAMGVPAILQTNLK